MGEEHIPPTYNSNNKGDGGSYTYLSGSESDPLLEKPAKSSRHGFPPPKLTPAFVFDNSVTLAEYKSEIHWAKTLLLGIIAGTYISIGSLLALTIGGGLPGFEETNPGLQKMIFAMVFPVGLLLVTISGAELVTSSLALLPVGVLEGTITWRNLAKNWFFSYIGNLIGSLFFVSVSLTAEVFHAGDTWRDFAMNVAIKKTSLSFLIAFTRGFLCNWLVCLAVWNTNGANDITGKVLAIWPCIMAFVAMGFEHCVANMYFIPLGIALGAEGVTVGDFIVYNLLPVTFGNLVGAVVMVSFTYSLAYGRSGQWVAGWWKKLTGFN